MREILPLDRSDCRLKSGFDRVKLIRRVTQVPFCLLALFLACSATDARFILTSARKSRGVGWSNRKFGEILSLHLGCIKSTQYVRKARFDFERNTVAILLETVCVQVLAHRCMYLVVN